MIPHDPYGSDLAVNASIDRHDMEAVACLHQLAQDSRRPQPKQCAPSNSGTVSPRPIWPRLPSCCPEGQLGQLARQRGEALRLRQQLRQRLLGEGADFGNADTRRHLKQNVACMDEVAALKILPVRSRNGAGIQLRSASGRRLPWQEGAG